MAQEDHIKIPEEKPRNSYVADGQQTTFPFTFPIMDETHLAVYLDDIREISGFSIIGVRVTNGGVVFFSKAPAAGAIVTLLRDVPIERMSDFQESGAIKAKVLNDEFDLLTTCLQDVAESARRSVTLKPTDSKADLQLPVKAERANKFLGFDTDGNAIAKTMSGGTGTGVEPGGSDTQVQFNDNGLLGGTSGLTYAKSTDTLSVAGDVRTDVLGENTADAGVNVDGVLAKDGKIASGHITPPGSDSEVLFNDGGSIGSDNHMYFDKSTNTLRVTGSVRTNWLYEHVGGAGVTIDQIKVLDTGVQADRLDEISPDAGVIVEGVLIKDGQVDGRDVAGDGAKLDGIEAGASADQTGTEIVSSINTELGGTNWQSGGGTMTGAQIKLAYEGEADTNAFTNALKAKLDAIEDGATGDLSASEVASLYESQVPFATQAELVAGTEAAQRRISPLLVRQAIEPLITGAAIEKIITTHLGHPDWKNGGATQTQTPPPSLLFAHDADLATVQNTYLGLADPKNIPQVPFSPPTQSSPIVINVGGGYYNNVSTPTDPNTDVIIYWPQGTTRNNLLHHVGGRNIRVIGGKSNANISCYGFTGSVWVEGVHTDLQGKEGDAFWFSPGAANTKIFVINSRIVGVTGTFAGTHSDCIQAACQTAQGAPTGAGYERLVVARCTFQTGYQGIQTNCSTQDGAPVNPHFDNYCVFGCNFDVYNPNTMASYMNHLGRGHKPACAPGACLWKQQKIYRR